MTTFTRFTLAECGHCGGVVLAGTVAGWRVQADSRTIPRRDAHVLQRHCLTVLLMERRPMGFFARVWDPTTHDLNRPGRYLVLPHVCSRKAAW